MTVTTVQHFINGQKVAGASGRHADGFHPASGKVITSIALANAAEVDAAVAAARTAWPAWSETPT